jgi:phosphoribosylaminoimidazole-succinocarboxamide synthase
VLAHTDLPFLTLAHRGKVRDVYRLDDQRLVLVATDRLSAFDRVLGCVDRKGELLTAISAWWFDQLADLAPHHLLAVPDPAASVVRAVTPLPVEVVVRGYLTGVTSTSLWPRYEAGERVLYGLRLPDGLAFNDPLPGPMITPTTKAPSGRHDEPLTSADVVARGLVPAARWARVVELAGAVFRRGGELAAAAGLTLVDTKYEFGVDDAGEVLLIDEVHTPDSSRFWRAGTTEHLDKELVRRWYAERGYRGDGDPPPWPEPLAARVGEAYAEVAERLLGAPVPAGAEPAADRLAANLAGLLPR